MRSAHRWWDRFVSWCGLAERATSSTLRSLYPEEVFHGLIHSESVRSERSGRPYRILLVYYTGAQGVILPMESEIAAKTASVLSMSLRATDSIGWYRGGYIVGGLLATLQPDSTVEEYNNLKMRVVDRLRGAMTFTDDRYPQVHVLERSELTALGSMQNMKYRT